MRAGTENLYGIVGFAKALEIATGRYQEDRAYIGGLKTYMAEQLQKRFPGILLNGDVYGQSLYTVLNVGFPMSERLNSLTAGALG